MLTNQSKTIIVHLLDGNPRGIRTAEMKMRPIELVLVPRSLTNSPVLKNYEKPALYFLFGQDEEGVKDQVYIGETGNGSKRIREHINAKTGKEFWNYAVIVTSNNDTFTRSDMIHLERTAIKNAEELKRYTVENKTIGKTSSIQPWEKSGLDEAFEIISLLLSALGFPLYTSKRGKETEKQDRILYLKGRGVTAKGMVTEEGFVVFKGSEMTVEPVDSFTGQHLVRPLEKKDVIKRQSKKYIFLEDHLFSSPSQAATVVLQRKSNGLEEWTDKAGVSLKKLQSEHALT